MTELLPLEKYCTSLNLPGLLHIEYIITDWIDISAYEKRIDGQGNWAIDIPLRHGSWLRVADTPSGKRYEQPAKLTKYGPIYPQLITSTVRSLRPTITDLLSRMMEPGYILRLTDRNGRQWVVGTLDAPLSFSYRATSAGGSGLNHYALRWAADTPFPAYGYLPV